MGDLARAIWLIGWNVWSAVFFVTGVALHVHAHVVLHRTSREESTGAPIANTVCALILYCLAIVAANRIEWTPFLIAFYVLFEVVLLVRPEEGQV